jgi:hypothetical protein
MVQRGFPQLLAKGLIGFSSRCYRSGVVVVFIHEMSAFECHEILDRTNVCRLACAQDNQPYVLPITYAFDGC